jgi:hypothetical protein
MFVPANCGKETVNFFVEMNERSFRFPMHFWMTLKTGLVFKTEGEESDRKGTHSVLMFSISSYVVRFY